MSSEQRFTSSLYMYVNLIVQQKQIMLWILLLPSEQQVAAGLLGEN